MVERVSGYDGAELVVNEGELAPAPAVQHLDDMLERRVGGVPRVVVPAPGAEGHRHLVRGLRHHRGLRTWDQDASVDEQVDAEEVPPPEHVLQRLAADTSYAVADLGTGCGAIALALARELPDAEVWATDASDDALLVARANVAGIGSAATRVRVQPGSWYDALPSALQGTLRIIVSNPPYVAEHEVADLPRDVADWEPRSALVSGPTGYEALEVLIIDACTWLDPAGGALVLELAPHQADRARELATAAGFTDVRVDRDLVGRARVLVARLAPAPGESSA
jgi:release factor glutamine methyltransferase